MSQELRYGAGESLRVDVPPESLLGDFTAIRPAPLDDPAAAVAAALAEPLDFPPLATATVPGDRIALALDHGVPQAEAVIAGVVHTLLEANAEPGDIVIVQARPGPDEPPPAPVMTLLPPAVRDQVRLETHDPTDSAKLAYLCTSKFDQPIYFNRTICDADVVIPIGSLRLEESLGYVGIHGCLFPTFSDEQTQRRFRASSCDEWQMQRQRRQEEAEEAAWRLGVQFTLQVIPGPGNCILHVLAGEARAVARQGRKLCEAAWHHQVPRRASLVVATIEGPPEQQTWENFARALFAAMQVVAENGTIVLCTDLQCRPGPALKHLASHLEDQSVARQIRRQRTPDVLPASLLLETREKSRIYLLSRLNGDLVEELGLGHVSHPAEIDRLSRRHTSCILLGNAHRALLTTVEEE